MNGIKFTYKNIFSLKRFAENKIEKTGIVKLSNNIQDLDNIVIDNLGVKQTGLLYCMEKEISSESEDIPFSILAEQFKVPCKEHNGNYHNLVASYIKKGLFNKKIWEETKYDLENNFLEKKESSYILMQIENNKIILKQAKSIEELNNKRAELYGHIYSNGTNYFFNKGEFNLDFSTRFLVRDH